MKIFRFLFACVLALALSAPVRASAQTRPKVGIEEKLGQTIPLDQ